MLYSVSEISENICKILQMKGVSEEDSKYTTDILLEADLRGYKSQGMERVFQILEGFHQKTLFPLDQSVIIQDHKAVTVIDGKQYLGQPLARRAMSLAIENSKRYGIGIAGVINAGHIGLLANYSEQASTQGCIGLVMTTSSPAVSIKGSCKKFLGTNPISYSIPSKVSHAITSDFSTSKVSRSKIYEYLRENKSLPEGWAINSSGEPTTSPKEALEGGIQTFDSGFKGASISLLISILAGPFIGGVINERVVGTRYMDQPPNKGDLFISLDISKFTNYNYFLESIEEIISYIKHENSDFHVPGSHSQRRKEEAILHGLEVSPELRDLFSKLDQGKQYAA